jgi:formiminotetrahydrofolate cyclodeaminase
MPSETAGSGSPFGDLLAELAERTPAPGGGCGTAWGGAIGAALLEMSALYAGDGTVAARASELRAELLALGEAERTSYLPVLAAYGLAPEDPDRRRAIAAALSQASDPPLAIARACAEVAELASAIAVAGKRELGGDAVAGATLAEGACQAALRLVELNLAADVEDARLAEVVAVGRRAIVARERALAP